MSTAAPNAGWSRREALKGLAAAGALSFVPRAFAAASASQESHAAIVRYLEGLSRKDGGYGFHRQQRSHLTPTFAVIGAYRLLGKEIPRRESLETFVRENHPRVLKKLEQERRIFEYQQVQALLWLGADASDFRERISRIVEPQKYYKQYERHGYPIFQSELGLLQCYALLGLPRDAVTPAFTEYVSARRRANGSFNNTPAADGGDGHVMNTLWGLRAMPVLGLAEDRRDETVAWLRACQRAGGSFTYQPEPSFAGIEDIAYTRAAVRGLQALGAEPANRSACLQWIHSLATADGGFSDRPGWESNPLATYYALDALEALGALETLGEAARPARRPRAKLPANLRVFSAQVQAHGSGSPTEAVALATALKIDLWGAKNAKPGWIVRAQQIARERHAPVQFFMANEEYGTWVDVPGLGTYSHTSDMLAPFGAALGPSRAGERAITWPEYQTTRMAEVARASGRFYWQFGENEEFVRLLLDDSIERGGFAAISTFHFGNPDFTNTEPFLQRWRGQIPWIALHDAHGVEPWWWSDLTTGYRTLFLGTEPTWEAWLEALQRNWTAAVRHDTVSRGETWMHAGLDEVADFVSAREAEWRWWGEPPAVRRPLGSLVVVRPEDEFEAGRPSTGVALRVRCAWHAVQNTPHHELATLVSLIVDGQRVEPTFIEQPQPRAPKGADRYHLLNLPNPGPGAHSAIATVREIATGREEQHTVQF